MSTSGDCDDVVPVMTSPAEPLLAPEHMRAVMATLAAVGVDVARHRPLLFGSRARGTARKYSDIDLGIAGEPLTLAELGRVTEAFEESDLPFRVDVVNFAHASEEFRQTATAGAIPLGAVAAEAEQ